MNNKHEVIVTRIDLPFTNILEIVFKFAAAAVLLSPVVFFGLALVWVSLGFVSL